MGNRYIILLTRCGLTGFFKFKTTPGKKIKNIGGPPGTRRGDCISRDVVRFHTGFDEHAMLIFNGFSLELNWPTSTWHKTSVSWNGNVHRAFGAAGNFAIGQVPSVDSTAFVLPYKVRKCDFCLFTKTSTLEGAN